MKGNGGAVIFMNVWFTNKMWTTKASTPKPRAEMTSLLLHDRSSVNHPVMKERSSRMRAKSLIEGKFPPCSQVGNEAFCTRIESWFATDKRYQGWDVLMHKPGAGRYRTSKVGGGQLSRIPGFTGRFQNATIYCSHHPYEVRWSLYTEKFSVF